MSDKAWSLDHSNDGMAGAHGGSLPRTVDHSPPVPGVAGKLSKRVLPRGPPAGTPYITRQRGSSARHVGLSARRMRCFLLGGRRASPCVTGKAIASICAPSCAAVARMSRVRLDLLSVANQHHDPSLWREGSRRRLITASMSTHTCRGAARSQFRAPPRTAGPRRRRGSGAACWWRSHRSPHTEATSHQVTPSGGSGASRASSRRRSGRGTGSYA